MTSRALWLIAAGTLALAGCGGSHSTTGSAGGGDTATASSDTAGDISGPPTINPMFDARDPRKCKPVRHVPSAAEAAALLQCAEESESNETLTLYQNVQVEMGESRPYQFTSDSHNTSIDTTTPVYPIRVTIDHYACTREKTCMVGHQNQAPGSCFKTTFGDWNCYYSVTDNVEGEPRPGQQPTTY